MPAALESLPIKISTLSEPTPDLVPDPDIKITSDEEESFVPAPEQPMDIPLMLKHTEIKAGVDSKMGVVLTYRWMPKLSS